ncbi:unnamed protein product [Meloidogyne enterolobii]|uniref:Uncharacterized protein n=1 Tax=Meloidogyne enterolobii TaxID=390850 RepID=A0ACB1ADL5_MELEN
MGSIISLEIFSADFLITLNTQESNHHLYIIIGLLIFALICSSALIIYKINRNCKKPQRNAWIPPPTLMALILIFLICSPTIEASNTKRNSKLRKTVKWTGKASASLLASSAAYLGLDYLAAYLLDNPDLSSLILAAITLLIITLLAAITLFAYKTFTSRNRSEPPLNKIKNLNESELKILRQLASQVNNTPQ